MKKSKLLIVLIMTVISFCFGISEIKALPECDFENNYGSVDITYKPHVGSSDTNVGLTRISYWCFNSNGTSLGAAAKSSCKNPSERFYIQFNVSKGISDDGGYVKSAKFTIYNNDDRAQCYIEPEITGEHGVYQFNFRLSKKEVSKIVAEGTYFDGDKEKSFGSDTFNINHEGDGSGANHTTIDGTTPTTLEEGVIGGVAKGTVKGSAKSMIQTDEDGNSYDSQEACTSVRSIVGDYWKYIMVIAPVLLIVMLSLDFFKAMGSNDADAIKKAGTNTIKRTIAAVILLALPALLSFIFGLFGLDLCI